MMHSRIGVMRALNRHVEFVFNPNRKNHHWGRRPLARDQMRKPATMSGLKRIPDSRRTVHRRGDPTPIGKLSL
jgi:hypothetical protein